MAKIRAWDSPLNAFKLILHRRQDFLLLEKAERDVRLTKQHYHLKMLNTPGWEGSLGENEYIYMYGCVPLPSTWSYHYIVNWLCVCEC